MGSVKFQVKICHGLKIAKPFPGMKPDSMALSLLDALLKKGNDPAIHGRFAILERRSCIDPVKIMRETITVILPIIGRYATDHKMYGVHILDKIEMNCKDSDARPAIGVTAAEGGV